MLHNLYARGIFTGINRELPYTGLSIVDAETTTDDVNIVIIQYYEQVTSSSGGLGDVSAGMQSGPDILTANDGISHVGDVNMTPYAGPTTHHSRIH